MPCRAVPYCAVLCHAVPCCAVLCCAFSFERTDYQPGMCKYVHVRTWNHKKSTPGSIQLRSAQQRNEPQCSALRCRALPCGGVLCHAARCCAVPCCAFSSYISKEVCTYMHALYGLCSWSMELLTFASRLFAPKTLDHLPHLDSAIPFHSSL